MKLHMAGKYDGNEENLPKREHPQNYVPFKEPQDMRKLAIIVNGISIALIVILMIPFIWLGHSYIGENSLWMALGFLASMVTFIPHEFLHAICFKGDVYMYSNLSKGMMFVVGTEDLSKARFVFLSLLPNLVFGVMPFIVFLVAPQITFLGAFGISCISMGAGDYMNVFNALTQMPKGAKTYLSGMHSFWYIP